MTEDNYPDPYKDCRPLPKEEKPKEPTGDDLSAPKQPADLKAVE